MTPRDFALIAQEAYQAKPDIGKPDSASRAIIRETDQGLCIAFPGTDNMDCWEADLKALPTTVDMIGRVHMGFWQAWKEISYQVAKRVGSEPVTFVGHSLGAAIAICAAGHFVATKRVVAGVYGFEPPRVSPDPNFTSLLLNTPVFLYKNGNDLVPDVPLFWHHAAPLQRIGKPLSPLPNVRDHAIEQVILALTPA